MKTHRFAASILACVLSLQMVLGVLPQQVFAEDNTALTETTADTAEAGREDALPEEDASALEWERGDLSASEDGTDIVELLPEKTAEYEDAAIPEASDVAAGYSSEGSLSDEGGTASEEKADFPAFEQTANLDDVCVTVSADEGVFPEGAALFAEAVKEGEREAVEQAAAGIRDPGRSVSASYVFDIRILDNSGNRIQPANGRKTELTFTLKEPADPDLTAVIYHVTEEGTEGLKAEKPEPVTFEDQSVIKVSADSFSYFVAELGRDETQEIPPAENRAETGGDSEEEAVPQEAPSVETEIAAVSRTNNIIGEVFANQINMANAEGAEDIRSASLEKYPLEHHELEYYGDSERVRFVGSGNESEPDYLVYRDSFFLIPEAESANYTVRISEDGDKAYISPAVSPEQISGKTGLVFLAEEVKNDSILVFADEPEYKDGLLIVNIKPTEEITVNELFSDGRLAFGEQQKKAMLKASPPIVTNPGGTNWSGSITSFKINDISGTTNTDIFDLYMTVGIHLEVEMDFDITTTGATGKKEYARIASINIPVELFDITVRYNLVAEFDENPMHVKGTIRPSFDYLFGTIGVPTNNLRSPVTITELTLTDESSYNKDVRFYIGSQFQIQGGFLGLTIDFLDIDIGPVLSVNFDMAGGCYLTARHEKDLYDSSVRTGTVIHTCAFHGEKGCLELNVDERYSYRLFFNIDLFFDDWDFDVKSTLERQVNWSQYYNTYTYGSGFQEGICPHKLFRIPVNVWLDVDKTQPAEAMHVTASDTDGLNSIEQEYAKGLTDADGHTDIYAPYRDKYRYVLTATGEIGGQTLSGSKEQMNRMEAGDNAPVDIVIRADARITLDANIIWDSDLEKKEVANGHIRLYVLAREAGTDDEWQIYASEANPYGRVIWPSDDWALRPMSLPAYGFDNGRAFPYEYIFRVYEDSEIFVPGLIAPERGRNYMDLYVDGYSDIFGNAVAGHWDKFHVTYEDEITEEGTVTTVKFTPVVWITLNKQWLLENEENKPSSVYLALLQSPEKGWDQIADQQGVPGEWLPVINPAEGGTNTLRKLMDKGLISIPDDISSIENVPLSITEVGDANGWSTGFYAAMYQNGVKMQYKAAELDASMIEILLRSEYSVEEPVSAVSFGDFVSADGPAVDTQLGEKRATVINTDIGEDGTVYGIVHWIYELNNWWDTVPEYIEIKLLKNGEELPESPVRLYKADHSEGDDTWTWSVKIEDYEPSAQYSVAETIPWVRTDRPSWIASYDGLNIYNYPVRSGDLTCEVQATFDTPPSITGLAPYVAEKDGSGGHVWDVYLRDYLNWYYRTEETALSSVKDISEYELVIDDVPGYVKVLDEPYAYRRFDYGILFYNFTAHYYLQSEELKLHLKNVWDADGSVAYPEEIPYKVYRDDELIAEGSIGVDPDTGETGEVVIDQDNDGNNLRRVDENGHKYSYSVVQGSLTGFTSEVTVASEETDDIFFELKNAWVGENYVNVSGTVNWEDDDNAKGFRPETVLISIINGDEERVRTLTLPVSEDGQFKAEYLPGKDKDGNDITYSVIESHIEGYTITYADSEFDEETHTWTCDVTNTLTGYYPLKIKKTVKGAPDNKDEIYTFTIEAVKTQEGDSTGTRQTPLPVNAEELNVKGAGEITADFLLDENGLYFYLLSEKKGTDETCVYDEHKYVVLIARTAGEDGKPVFTSYVKEAPEDISQINSELYFEEDSDYNDDEDREKMEKLKSDTVEFINLYPNVRVEKDWDIDIEGLDRPDSIEVVVQKNNNGSWENVRLVELSSSNDWKESIFFEEDPDREGEYRARELKEESALDSFISDLRGNIGDGSADAFSSVWNSIKESGYYAALPESIRNAGDEGADSLQEKLGAETEELYDKLIEQIGLTTAAGRIIYDKEDSDKGEGTTNQVTYHVGGYVSVVSGNVDAHETKYKVTYGSDGNGTCTITNKAILEIDLVKKWYSYGVDDDDMPDSAWLVLLAKPSEGAVSAAADIAEAAGIDLGGILNYEFPVIDPVEGGTDPVNLISQLMIGVDINVFSGLNIIPKLAIAKAEKNDDSSKSWRVHFVDSKYHLGIPVEYKGAELSSEIIRQVVKYISKLDLPVSFNPFDMYISIPGKAKGKTQGFGLDDFDLSKLISVGKQLTEGDLGLMDLPSAFTSNTDLAANVINVKIGLDDDDDEDPDKLEGKKIWVDDTEEKRPDYIKIHIKDGNTEVDGSPITLQKADFAGKDTWNWEFELPEDADEDAEYVVYEEWPADYADKDHYTCEKDDLDLTNTWHDEAPETITISGKVVWKDKNDQDGIRPDQTTLYLLANGSRVKGSDGNDLYAETSKAGDFRFFFPNRPRKDAAGNEITYTVEEKTTDVITGTDAAGTYAYAIDGSASGGFTVVNTHTPETVTLSGKKIWDDDNDRDGIRPESITVRLLADGKEADSGTVTVDDGWIWTFADMPKNKAGQEIIYTLEEDDITGYTPRIDGLDVTNTHKPAKTQVDVTLQWDDKDDQDGIRPDDVTIKLLADGADTGKTLTLPKDGSLIGSFEDLYVNKAGSPITYTVQEMMTAVITGTDGPGTYAYGISGDAAEGFTVTNTHTPETVTLSGSKIWNDQNNQDGLRPEKITVRLMADGEEVDSATVTVDENWAWAFPDKPKYKAGEEIVYTLKEDSVSGYIPRISGMDVTNTHEPAKTRVDVTLEWDDADDQDGIRPDEVTVKLLADGEDTGKTLTLPEDGSLTGSFADLDVNKAGSPITYTVQEVTTAVITGTDGSGTYAYAVDGSVAGGFTVTNTHTPETVTLSGSKTWDDADDQDGLRPDDITVRLMAGGVEADSLKVTADDGWTWTFADKPKYKAGQEIVYTLEEDGVSGYTPRISGMNVTNTHEPVKTDVEVTLVWDDADDQDGIRPDEVTVKLLADGEDTGKTLTLPEDGSLTGSFADLDVNKAGSPITYTVQEVTTDVITGTDGPGTYAYAVTGSAGDGFAVTNTHTPETVEVQGFKTWDDADDQDGVRPESITIRLRADNEEIDLAQVTAGEEWKWSFTELPKYAGGTPIGYSVTEDRVEDYISAVEGFNVTNTHAPGRTQVSVGVVWEDKNDLDQIRPEKVTIRLLADGEDTGEKLILSAEDGWRGTFENLDARKAGTDIVYTIEEEHDDVLTGTDGERTYAIAADGDMSQGFTVTNTHTPVFEIRYVLNGGTFNGSAEDIVEKYRDGTTILIHEKPVREGYTFLYWRGSEYQPGDSYTVEEDHTFTAVWEKDKPRTYTVTFDENGHGTAPAAQTVREGEKAVRPADPSAGGYVFGGWFTEKECREAFDFDTPIMQDITLYAKWTERPDTPDGNGGTDNPPGGKNRTADPAGVAATKTGDESRTGSMLLLLTASMLCLAVLLLKRKRSE